MTFCRILVVALLGVPVATHAELKPKWEIGIGLAPILSPDYRGSDQSRTYTAPLPYLVYHGDILKMDRRGLYGRLVDTDRIRLDLSFDAGVPVNSRKNRARQGMPDLDPVFEVGPSIEVCLWNRCDADRVAQFRLPVRAVYSTDFSSAESRGGTVYPHLNFDAKRMGGDRSWNFSASAGVLYASERFHDYYYQVDSVYSTTTRPAYDAEGGFSGVRATVTFSRRFRKVWVGGFARYDDLSGAVFEDSPLVRIHRAFMAGIAVAWVIAESSDLVDVRD